MPPSIFRLLWRSAKRQSGMCTGCCQASCRCGHRQTGTGATVPAASETADAGLFHGPGSDQPVVRRLIKDFVCPADASRECLLLMDEDTLHPRIQRPPVPWRPGRSDKDELAQLVRSTYRKIKREATAPLWCAANSRTRSTGG